MKKLQLTFNSKYKTIHRIGLTQKSQIYKAINIQTQQQIAIKLQPFNEAGSPQQQNQIQKQAKIYRLIKGGVGIPNLYWYGTQHSYRALVTDIYGPSLQHLLKFCQGTFSLKTVSYLLATFKIFSLQLNRSRKLFDWIRKKADKIFAIDFGNCKKYVDQQNNHYFISKQSNPVKNNFRFRSIHAHIGKKTSRRDDLESLGYLIVYFLKGSLPWDSIDEENPAVRQLLIKQNKASLSIKNLCENLPEQFQKYFNYVKTLQFEEEPDYVWIKRNFKDLFEKKGFADNNIMDWAEKHKY